eukprot:426894_1
MLSFHYSVNNLNNQRGTLMVANINHSIIVWGGIDNQSSLLQLSQMSNKLTLSPTINPNINPSVNTSTNPTFSLTINPTINPTINSSVNQRANLTKIMSTTIDPVYLSQTSTSAHWMYIILAVIVGMVVGLSIGLYCFKQHRGKRRNGQNVIGTNEATQLPGTDN